jgi:Tfp pilus assembly protein PilF
MSTRFARRLAVVTAIVAVGGLVLAAGLRASESPSKSEPPSGGSSSQGAAPESNQATGLYNEGLTLAKNGDYEKARDLFERANRLKKNDPDILNMLAFTQRKTGKLDEAFGNYKKALSIQPRFPRAREYMAEAHLQAALEQLAILRSYGPEGAEDAQKLVEALHQTATAAGGGEAEPGAATKKGGSGGW